MPRKEISSVLLISYVASIKNTTPIQTHGILTGNKETKDKNKGKHSPLLQLHPMITKEVDHLHIQATEGKANLP